MGLCYYGRRKGGHLVQEWWAREVHGTAGGRDCGCDCGCRWMRVLALVEIASGPVVLMNVTGRAPRCDVSPALTLDPTLALLLPLPLARYVGLLRLCR